MNIFLHSTSKSISPIPCNFSGERHVAVPLCFYFSFLIPEIFGVGAKK